MTKNYPFYINYVIITVLFFEISTEIEISKEIKRLPKLSIDYGALLILSTFIFAPPKFILLTVVSNFIKEALTNFSTFGLSNGPFPTLAELSLFFSVFIPLFPTFK